MHSLKCIQMRARVEKVDVLGWNKSIHDPLYVDMSLLHLVCQADNTSVESFSFKYYSLLTTMNCPFWMSWSILMLSSGKTCTVLFVRFSIKYI